MSKGTKITSFFEGRRREAFLRSWEHLKSTAGESRIKLDISMPLLNHDVQGMPDAVTKQYAVMCEDKTSTARANLDSFAEGMTIEIFTTDESKERVAMSSGCLLKSWHMISSPRYSFGRYSARSSSVAQASSAGPMKPTAMVRIERSGSS